MLQTAEHCTLLDAGRFTDTVVNNAIALQVDLGCVRDIVLSHFHFDHTSRMARVVARIRTSGYADKLNVCVAEGFFNCRIIDKNHTAGDRGLKVFGASSVSFMQEKRAQLDALGLVFTKSANRLRSRKASGPPGRYRGYIRNKIALAGSCCKSRMRRPHRIPWESRATSTRAHRAVGLRSLWGCEHAVLGTTESSIRRH